MSPEGRRSGHTSQFRRFHEVVVWVREMEDGTEDKAITMEEPVDDESDSENTYGNQQDQIVGPQQIAALLEGAKHQSVSELSLAGLLKKAHGESSDQEVEVPSEITDLVALTKLNLSSNSIPSLPPLFGLLEALTELDLSRNRLASLPSSFSRLHSLQILDLSSNAFTQMPEECHSHLPKLVSLR